MLVVELGLVTGAFPIDGALLIQIVNIVTVLRMTVSTPASTGTGEAILAAAREEFVRYGIRRANVAEIGRRAGVSRVTVHRRFTSKSQLVRAVVMADVASFAERFDACLFGDGALAERITDAVALAVSELRNHPLLTTLMASEPEAIALQMTSEGEAEFRIVAGLLAARLDALVERGELRAVDSGLIAEALVRIWYSMFLLPFGDVLDEGDKAVRAFARAVVLPMVGLGHHDDG
jgi:TetR/AcrR family transcriptional repressor of uid operon